MHKVLRTFTDGVGRVKIGDIIDASQYRNLGRLVRRGYLTPVGDDSEPTLREVPAVVEEETVGIAIEETPIETEPESDVEIEEPAVDPIAFGSNVDIIDQLANIPDAPPPAKATKPTKSAKRR